MEDLWCVESSGVDIDDFASFEDYKRFLERFRNEEENDNRRRLQHGDESGK